MDGKFDVVRSMIVRDSPAMRAFDYGIAHALAAAFELVPYASGSVLSIELKWPARRNNPFSLQVRPQHINFYLRGPILDAHPGLFDAAVARFGPVKNNSREEYRTRRHNVAEMREMLDFLRGWSAWPDRRTDQRFVAATFAPVTGQHFLDAARRLATGFGEHRFGTSTEYDLLFDGHRLAPKAVFGLAASEALGFPVGPENFSAGESMVCFRKLRASGYPIVPKGWANDVDPALVSEEDRVWSEGQVQLVTHLRRERGTGLAEAKRAQFRSKHGRLYCERCKMDPVAVFGSDIGEACIEVHHDNTQVANMGDGHQTWLEDLQCLCANCHRVTHRELKAGISVGDW